MFKAYLCIKHASIVLKQLQTSQHKHFLQGYKRQKHNFVFFFFAQCLSHTLFANKLTGRLKVYSARWTNQPSVSRNERILSARIIAQRWGDKRQSTN